MLIDNGLRFSIAAVRQGGEVVTAAAIDIDNPLLIPPFTEDNLLAVVEVDITFAPGTNADFTDRFIVRPGGLAADQRVTVNLSGSSKGPPEIEVDTTELEYGTIGAGALLLGSVDFKTVTIRNSGDSDLVIEPRMGGGVAAADFTVSPSFLAPIPPSGAVVISIFYNPTTPSDPTNTFTPAAFISAALNITSNDTNPNGDVLKTIPLKGWARSGVQDQVLVVEMEFDNADNSWAGSDFRNVDLAIRNVDNELTCTKPRFVSVGAGNQGVFEDGCDEWNEFSATPGNALGQTSWLGIAPFEEPERVVVRGLGPNGGNGQRFEIKLSYVEDCANIPSGLLSDILGIGSSVLLGLLGGAIGVPIAVPPGQISDTIANNCFDHAASTVTTRISLNGTVVAAPSTRLGRKGDQATVARLKRLNGAFCSETAGVGAPALQCQ